MTVSVSITMFLHRASILQVHFTVIGTSTKWNEEALLLAFIPAYRLATTKRWANVASAYADLVGEEDPIDGEAVRLKVRNLRDRYQKWARHNNTSGNDPIDIPELYEDAFGLDDVLPPTTVESSSNPLGT